MKANQELLDILYSMLNDHGYSLVEQVKEPNRVKAIFDKDGYECQLFFKFYRSFIRISNRTGFCLRLCTLGWDDPEYNVMTSILTQVLGLINRINIRVKHLIII